MELHKEIRAKRVKRGLSQAKLGAAVGISQPAVKKIESGETVRSRYIREIADFLEIVIPKSEALEATSEPDVVLPQIRVKPLPKREDPDRPIPVYSSAEGGDGSLIVSSEPIEYAARPNILSSEDDLYGVVIEGTSMMKAYRPGDTAWVHPKYRERRDEPCVFRRYDDITGDTSMTIKWLNDFNSDVWKVEQFNPQREFELDRKDWPECYRVLGKKNRT